ncbi:helix-turn-helix transcriptional regulator [Burkholderia sp. 22313]|uniref:helix-turn-helix transcriptional regulator n=1 Tax=Burkholderia sp. 22313 TaxID=3453908 RepID=UPI003F87D01A
MSQHNDPTTFEDMLALLPMRVSRPTIKRWIEKEGFPAPIRLGDRTRFWRRAEVLAWVAARELSSKEVV